MNKKEEANALRLNRVECGKDFELLIEKKEEFVSIIGEGTDISEINGISGVELISIQKNNEKIIRKIYNASISYSNKLDVFCSKILDKTYYCEEYIRTEVKNAVYDMIISLPDLYNYIRGLYQKYNIQYSFPESYKQQNLEKFLDLYFGQVAVKTFKEKRRK